MKIGILTYHYALNCGAVLQALALQDYLTSEGHQVEFVNYENDYVNLAYKLFRFKLYNPHKPIEYIKRFLNDASRIPRFPKFRKCTRACLHIGEQKQTKDIYDMTNYNCIIIGSDQLWNKKITKDFDFFYCAKFDKMPGQRVIGYAISMNKCAIDENEQKELQEIMSRFDSLSVRESTSVSLLQPLIDKKVNLVIDPTFLLGKDRWMKYTHPVKEKEYICCYPVLNQEQVKVRARIIAKKLKKKLVILEPVADGVFLSDGKKVNTPFEFLSYMAQTDMVLTSSFHGTAFSLVMKKDFYVLGDDNGNVRMKSFLEKLGIEERIIPLDKDVDIDDHIDYENVAAKLNGLINSSKKFLRDSLSS